MIFKLICEIIIRLSLPEHILDYLSTISFSPVRQRDVQPSKHICLSFRCQCYHYSQRCVSNLSPALIYSPTQTQPAYTYFTPWPNSRMDVQNMRGIRCGETILIRFWPLHPFNHCNQIVCRRSGTEWLRLSAADGLSPGEVREVGNLDRSGDTCLRLSGIQAL